MERGRHSSEVAAPSSRTSFDSPIVPFPCADRAPTIAKLPGLIGIAAMAERAPLLEAKSRVEYRDIECRSILSKCEGMPFQWTINPYRGCEFGCHYCYARYTHQYMEMHDSAAFEQKIFAKSGAAAILRRELARGKGQGGIALGAATDPYQPAERRYGITREILAVLAEARDLNIGITTKSDLVARDIPLILRIAKRSKISVNMTIITLSESLARALEQRAPRPQLRLEAVRRLREAGIEAGVSVMPVIPCITDRYRDLDSLFAAAKSVGASYIAANVLFLMPCAQRQFFPFLAEKFPSLVERYRKRYEGGAYIRGEYPERIQAMVHELREKYGLTARTKYFQPNEVVEGAKQLELF
jgi:DNA repair photolyase